MTTPKTLVLLILLGMAALPGCRRNTEPPPRSVVGDAGYLAPVIVPPRLSDRSIIAAAPPLPETGAKGGETPAETAPSETPAETPKAEGEKAEAPGNEPAAEPSETPGDKAAKQSAAKPSAQPAEKPADKTAAKPAPKRDRGPDELEGLADPTIPLHR